MLSHFEIFLTGLKFVVFCVVMLAIMVGTISLMIWSYIIAIIVGIIIGIVVIYFVGWVLIEGNRWNIL